MRLAAVVAASLLAAASLARAEDQAKWTEIDVPELEKAIQDGQAVVIDNNPKFVWEERRLPGAKWLHAMTYTAKDLPEEKGAMLVFYCMNEN